MIDEVPGLASYEAQRTDSDPRRKRDQRYPRRQALRRPVDRNQPRRKPDAPDEPDEPQIIGSRLDVKA